MSDFHKLCHEPLPRVVRGKNNGNTYYRIGNGSVCLEGGQRFYYSYNTVIGISLNEYIAIVGFYNYSNTTSRHQWDLRKSLPNNKIIVTKYAIGYGYVEMFNLKYPDLTYGNWLSKRKRVREYLDKVLPSKNDLLAILILNYGIDINSFDSLNNLTFYELYEQWLDIKTEKNSTEYAPSIEEVKNLYKYLEDTNKQYNEYLDKRKSTKEKNNESKRSKYQTKWIEEYEDEIKILKNYWEDTKEMTIAEKLILAPKVKLGYIPYYVNVNNELELVEKILTWLQKYSTLSLDDKVVETNHKVRFPLILLAKLVRSINVDETIDRLLTQKDWLFNINLGYEYTVQSTEEGLIKIGCHYFDPDYLKLIIPKLIKDSKNND